MQLSSAAAEPGEMRQMQLCWFTSSPSAPGRYGRDIGEMLRRYRGDVAELKGSSLNRIDIGCGYGYGLGLG